MGQTDIFCALLIYLSLILFIRCFDSDEYVRLLFLSAALLGFSMTFKTYGGLLLPIYIVISFFIFKNKINDFIKICGYLTRMIFIFILPSIFVWAPYASSFNDVIFSGESNWLLNLRIAPLFLAPYHNISIWLLGYTILLYKLINDLVNHSDTCTYKRYFVFYFKMNTPQLAAVGMVTNRLKDCCSHVKS